MVLLILTRDSEVPGSWSWRLPLAAQLIPGAILALGTLMLPESPRYLVASGDDDEAVRVLRQLRNASDGGNEELIQVHCTRVVPLSLC